MYTGKGVLSNVDLHALINQGTVIPCNGFKEKHIAPASIDITISGEVYRLDRLMRPSGKRNEIIRSMLPALGAHPIKAGAILVPGEKYIAKASLEVDLPKDCYGFSNAKSTSGRNMCLVRTLTDTVEGYDTVSKHGESVKGEIWLTFEPLVFPVFLTQEECYCQVRFFNADTRIMNDEVLGKELKRQPLLYRQNGSLYKEGELALASGDGTLYTTFYGKAGKLVGFRARKTLKPLDLTQRNLNPKGYFEPVYAETDPSDPTGGLVTLEPGWYYLLSTNEQLHVPEHMCAELIAVNPRLGLFYSHFAGFFDPGFRGTPTLEVTCLIPTTIRHREAVGCFRYEYMRSETISYASTGNYNLQRRTTLPKQFSMPEEWRVAMG